MDIIEEDNDFSIYNVISIINYIKEHFIQILLLILVFFIVYTVDHISNINAMIMSQMNTVHLPQIKIPKEGKRYKSSKK